MFILVKYIIPLVLVATTCSAVNHYGYGWKKETGNCYKFHNVAETWWRAHAVCLSENAYLVVINSRDEANIIKQIFEEKKNTSIGSDNTNYAHVGFIDWEHNKNWYTIIDGKPLAESGFVDWANGEPSGGYDNTETCGSIYQNGCLNDIRCKQKASFICEKSVDTCSDNLSSESCVIPRGSFKLIPY